MMRYKSCPKCGAILKVDTAFSGRVTCSKCHVESDASELKDVPSVTVMCPQCRTRLVSYNIDGNVGIKCRSCSYVGSLAEFKAFAENFNRRPEVNVPPVNVIKPDAEEGTQINLPQNNRAETTRLARLNAYAHPLSLQVLEDKDGKWDVSAERIVSLKTGRVVVGRRGGNAQLQLPTSDMFMGRMHFIVEVKYDANKGLHRHCLSDNGSVNGTRFKAKDGEWIKLDTMSVVVLNDGDLIEVGHTILKVVYASPK